VRAPREQVFQAATDPSQASRFFRQLLPVPGIAKAEPFAADGGATKQRKCRWTDGSTTTDELIAHVAPLRHAYRWANTLQGPVSWLFRSAVSDWTFTPTEQGTSIYWTYRFEPRYGWLKPAMNIAQNAFQRWMRANLQTLKQALESAQEHA
jgi:uncharacterized protein YndB with AHSA1/START domain